jgi:hypothetical protein
MHSTRPLRLAGKSARLDSLRFKTKRARGESEEEEPAGERVTPA